MSRANAVPRASCLIGLLSEERDQAVDITPERLIEEQQQQQGGHFGAGSYRMGFARLADEWMWRKWIDPQERAVKTVRYIGKVFSSGNKGGLEDKQLE